MKLTQGIRSTKRFDSEYEKDFILEVGKDFTFIDEEYRVQVGGEDFRTNLFIP